MSCWRLSHNPGTLGKATHTRSYTAYWRIRVTDTSKCTPNAEKRTECIFLPKNMQLPEHGTSTLHSFFHANNDNATMMAIVAQG